MIFEINGDHIKIVQTETDRRQLEVANTILQEKRSDELERKMKALMKHIGITEL